ncbi:MAG: glycosyltransferase [Devosia sp.]|uniref:glycosyltransferase family 2 protein n=1 Tax=Devosia sp. TaxID=1871048 RepID=UPI0026282246|nr:glycosyltransferase family A protein [Devosia sp.]MDB5540763.1 glycosyltransferase [Devosia sp.]
MNGIHQKTAGLRPIVTVVIPCLNASEYVAAAVESCVGQSYSNLEIVLVDNGSTDGSLRICEELAARYDFVQVLVEDRKGACYARNGGLAISRGEFVVFLDADDLLAEGAIDRLVGALERSPDAIPLSLSYTFEKDPLARRIHFHPLLLWRRGGFRPKTRWLFDHTPPVSCALYRRSDLISVGGFDERLLNRQDIDLFMRVLLRGGTPIYCGAPSLLYRNHPSTDRISRRPRREMVESQAAMLSKLQTLCISTGGERSVELIDALSERAWKWGRELVRVGLIDDAKRYFSLSAEIGGGTAPKGPLWYRFPTWIVGPIWAERAIECLKRRLGYYRN